MRKHRCPGGVKVVLSRPVRGLGLLIPNLNSFTLHQAILFTLCVLYSRIMHEKTWMSWWCKGSTLSRHVRGLGFDSRVRTLFSIDLCCIYLVFTMLFIFVKRMYS